LGRPGERIFAVSRHADVKRILHEPATFSSRFGSPAAKPAPELLARLKAVTAEGWPNVPTMLTEDPPVHTRYRHLVSKAFTPKRVSLLEPAIQAICEDLVAGFDRAPRVDFLNQFAVPVPVRAVAVILEVPETRQADFKRWADSSVAAIGRSITDDERVAAERDIVEQQQYFASELDARRTDPRDDFLTDLLNADDRREFGLRVGQFDRRIDRVLLALQQREQGELAAEPGLGFEAARVREPLEERRGVREPERGEVAVVPRFLLDDAVELAPWKHEEARPGLRDGAHQRSLAGEDGVFAEPEAGLADEEK
jgi:hypothetical protein